MKSISLKRQIEIGIYLLISFLMYFSFRNFASGFTLDFIPSEYFQSFQPYFSMLRLISLLLHVLNTQLIKEISQRFGKTGVLWDFIIPIIFFIHPLMIEGYLAPFSVITTFGTTIFLVNLLCAQAKKYKMIMPLYFLGIVLNQAMLFTSIIFADSANEIEDHKFKKIVKYVLIISTVFFTFLTWHYFTPIKIQEIPFFSISVIATLVENFFAPIGISSVNVNYINLFPVFWFVELFLIGAVLSWFLKVAIKKQDNFLKLTVYLVLSGILGSFIFPWRNYNLLGLDWLIFKSSFYTVAIIGLSFGVGLLLELMSDKKIQYALGFAIILMSFFVYPYYFQLWSSNTVLINDSMAKISQSKVRDFSLREKMYITNFFVLLNSDSIKEADAFLNKNNMRFIQNPEYLKIALYLKTSNLDKLFELEKELSYEKRQNPVLLLALAGAYKDLNSERSKIIYATVAKFYLDTGKFAEPSELIPDKTNKLAVP